MATLARLRKPATLFRCERMVQLTMVGQRGIDRLARAQEDAIVLESRQLLAGISDLASIRQSGTTRALPNRN